MTDKSSEFAALNRVSDVIHAVSGANQFATDLYSLLAGRQAGDIVFSPNGVMLALAMAFAGARGETAAEMASTLRLQISPERTHEAFRTLQATTLANDVELRIANRLWCQTGYHFLAEYLSLTERYYGSRVADVDFRSHAEDARRQINEWIEQQTAGKIKDMVAPRTFNEMTRLVLTNAMYFLGGWQDEFDETSTKTAPFWSKPGEEHSVQMMHQTDLFRYGDFDDLQVIEMPYRYLMQDERLRKDATNRATALAMTFLLPRTIDGLSIIEAALSPLTLGQWTTLRLHQVNVAIPKFRIESGFQMGEALRSMGMEKAFSVQEADFSGISDDPEGLFIGEVVHKAFIDVNEKGTEAAAATAMVMVGGCAIPTDPSKEFRADHPFLFLIRDRNTRMIHFMGRVTGKSCQ